MHDFGKDFYGSLLKIMMLGYLRPMQAFPNLGKSCMVLRLAGNCGVSGIRTFLKRPDLC